MEQDLDAQRLIRSVDAAAERLDAHLAVLVSSRSSSRSILLERQAQDLFGTTSSRRYNRGSINFAMSKGADVVGRYEAEE